MSIYKVYASEEYVDDKIEEKRIQPDWNQNGPTAADYVKNRTHYAEVGEKTLFDGEASAEHDYNFLVYQLFDDVQYIDPTKTYSVYFDGGEYKDIVPSFDGDEVYLQVPMEYKGETLERFIYNGQQFSLGTWHVFDKHGEDVSDDVMATYESLAIKIAVNEEVVHKLPRKYVTGAVAIGVVEDTSYGMYGLNTELGATSKELVDAVKNGGWAAVALKLSSKYGILWCVGEEEWNGTDALIFTGAIFDTHEFYDDMITGFEMHTLAMPSDPSIIGFPINTLMNVRNEFETKDYATKNGDNYFVGTNTFNPNSLVLADSANKKWKLVVGTDGTLSTEAVT